MQIRCKFNASFGWESKDLKRSKKISATFKSQVVQMNKGWNEEGYLLYSNVYHSLPSYSCGERKRRLNDV